MNTKYSIVDMENWKRKDEYEYFSYGGCNFNITSRVDITRIYEYHKKNNIKLYSILASLMIKALNSFEEFKYGYIGKELVIYDVVHPTLYDLNKDNKLHSYCPEYSDDIPMMIKSIDEMSQKYKESNAYRCGEIPNNSVMISNIPWIDIYSMSFDLQYGFGFLAPIIAFGKYETVEDKKYMPISIYVNHKVADGYHVSMLIKKFGELATLL